MAFEQAQMVKEKIALLENYQAKSTIVNPKINDVDVFSIVSDEQYAYVNFFKWFYSHYKKLIRYNKLHFYRVP